MQTAEKRKYRVPSAYISHDVSLSEFSIDEMVEYIRNKGEPEDIDRIVNGEISKPGGQEPHGLYIAQADLNTAETLLLCGQREEARALIFQLVSHHIGRSL